MDEQKKRLAGRVTVEIIEWMRQSCIPGDIAVTALLAAAAATAIGHKQQDQFHRSVQTAIATFETELKVREVTHANVTIH